MSAGISATMAQAVQVALQYLGVGKAKRVTEAKVDAVLADGTLVVGDTRLRTSGTARGVRAGEKVSVLSSRGAGRRMVPTAVLKHQTRQGAPSTPPRPTSQQLVNGIIEELFIAPVSATDSRLDIWFRNDKQITRLDICTRIAVDDNPDRIFIDLVQWGQSPDAFLVRAVDTFGNGNRTYYVFRLHMGFGDRLPGLVFGAIVPTAVLDHIETWSQMAITTVTVLPPSEAAGVDLIIDLGTQSNGFTPSLIERGISASNNANVQTITLLDDETVAVNVHSEYLTPDRHVLLVVKFSIDVGWGGRINRTKRSGGAFSTVNSGLSALTDLLYGGGSCEHTAWLNLTTKTVLWSSTGPELTVNISMSAFRRLWHGRQGLGWPGPYSLDATNGHPGPWAALRGPSSLGNIEDDMTEESYMGSAQQVEPPPSYIYGSGTLDVGTVGGGISVGPTYALSWFPGPTVAEVSRPIMRHTVPNPILAFVGLQATDPAFPSVTLFPTETPVYFLTGNIIPHDPGQDEREVVRITGTAVFTGVRGLQFNKVRVLHYDVDPTKMRVLVSVSVGNDHALLILDGTGALIQTLTPWTSGVTIRLLSANRYHVLWTEDTGVTTLIRMIQVHQLFLGTNFEVPAAPVTIGGMLTVDFLKSPWVGVQCLGPADLLYSPVEGVPTTEGGFFVRGWQPDGTPIVGFVPQEARELRPLAALFPLAPDYTLPAPWLRPEPSGGAYQAIADLTELAKVGATWAKRS